MTAFRNLGFYLLPTLLLAALPSCRRETDATTDAEWWTLETQRVELVQELRLQEVRLGNARVAREYEALVETVERNRKQLAG